MTTEDYMPAIRDLLIRIGLRTQVQARRLGVSKPCGCLIHYVEVLGSVLVDQDESKFCLDHEPNRTDYTS